MTFLLDLTTFASFLLLDTWPIHTSLHSLFTWLVTLKIRGYVINPRASMCLTHNYHWLTCLLIDFIATFFFYQRIKIPGILRIKKNVPSVTMMYIIYKLKRNKLIISKEFWWNHHKKKVNFNNIIDKFLLIFAWQNL